MTENEEHHEGNLEKQEVEFPPPDPQPSAGASIGKRCSQAEARPKSKKARLQSLTEAVKEVRKVQEVLANTDCLSENEAFGNFVTASLNKLPPVASVMAQGDIQQILKKYRLDSLSGNCSASLASNYSLLSSTENISWDSSSAPTPHEGSCSNQFPLVENEDTAIPDDAASFGNIIHRAWNLTNQ